MNRFVFGPVPSRRLGFSLGVDVIPKKYCSFDCVYCQVGKTTEKNDIRSSFFDPATIVDEIIREAHAHRLTDFVTFSGSGEPTLNQDLGTIIRAVKKRISTPVAVITNGSLLARPDVRSDLMEADLVVPSLDAVTEDVLLRINRPAPSVKMKEMIDGLRTFGAEYRGRIWLEIMLIENINDDMQHIELLREVVRSIRVDKIQLNTVTRPPCEATVKGITDARIAEIQEFFGPKAETICMFEKRAGKGTEKSWTEDVLDILRRRSLTLEDVIAVTGIERTEADRRLRRLVKENRIKERLVGSALYYAAAD